MRKLADWFIDKSTEVVMGNPDKDIGCWWYDVRLDDWQDLEEVEDSLDFDENVESVNMPLEVFLDLSSCIASEYFPSSQ